MAKIRTARKLQARIGGEIVFFCHDSDHDPRETKTILRHRKTNEIAHLNFSFANKIQRKFSPLYLKRVPGDWHEKTLLQLPNYVEHSLIDIFRQTSGQFLGRSPEIAASAADFCIEMYRNLSLLDGIRVARSSDPALRRAACEIGDFYVDAPYEGEIVRARVMNGELKLHEGGDQYVTVPAMDFSKEQISPTRDTRLRWMQSVVHCTHYVAGAGEQAYLHHDDAPDITFLTRDAIERSDEAYVEIQIRQGGAAAPPH